MPLLQGRDFSPEYPDDTISYIINEEALKMIGYKNPIGQPLTFFGHRGKIIGVVKDFKYKSLHDKTGPLVAFQNPAWFRLFMARVAPNQAVQAIKNVEAVWRQFFPGAALEYHFLDDHFNQLYKADQQTATLILGFSLIAIIISALGLFALTTFTVEQKTKEIGIRKVLGASVLSIARFLTKDFLRLIVIAIIIALPLAWLAMSRWLQDFAYRINITVWIFAIAGIITVAIAIVTISFQAIKAATANPVKALRSE